VCVFLFVMGTHGVCGMVPLNEPNRREEGLETDVLVLRGDQSAEDMDGAAGGPRHTEGQEVSVEIAPAALELWTPTGRRRMGTGGRNGAGDAGSGTTRTNRGDSKVLRKSQ